MSPVCCDKGDVRSTSGLLVTVFEHLEKAPKERHGQEKAEGLQYAVSFILLVSLSFFTLFTRCSRVMLKMMLPWASSIHIGTVCLR